MTDYTVQVIPALEDNYIYLIRWENRCLLVDPGEAKPVLEILERENLQLDSILITHHHADHIGGVKELKERGDCRVIAPEDERLPWDTETVSEGDSVQVGPFHFEVIFVPGHTMTHISFYEPQEQWLFSGDSLFAGGCGRLFEGTPEVMFDSMGKLALLPDETELYCGHEYTLSNLRFARHFAADNSAIQERFLEVQKLREAGVPSIPSRLGEEKRTNPFLLCDEVESFTQARLMKDKF
jgi:hydroxyacylglutathione hydrolase